MSHFLEEESPWAQDLPSSTLDASGLIDPTTSSGISPWAQPDDEQEESASDHSRKNSDTDDRVFRDPYGYDEEAQVHTTVEDDEDDPLSTLTSQRKATPDFSFVRTDSMGGDENEPQTNTRRGIRRRRALKAPTKVEAVADDPLSASVAIAGPRRGYNKDDDGLDDVSLAMSAHTLEDRVHTGMLGEDHEDSAPDNHQRLRSPPLPVPEQTPQGPKFEIHVGDPTRVGDYTKVHTEYTVNTDVEREDYPAGPHSVLRRYRDFRWLYRALQHSHPGIVVPPPPDKQAVGRFNDEFVEQRRTALEQMLRKIVLRPQLVGDADLRAFLTAGDFTEFLKNRVLSYEELEEAAVVDAAGGGGSSSGGIMSALLGKGEEPDPWLVARRSHLDAVESQLRAVFRALDAVGQQRRELANSIAEFANVTEALANIEPTRRLGEVLRGFSQVYERLGELYTRQRQQDMVTLEATLNEHVRVVGSVRDALGARQRVNSQAEAVASELEKKQAALEKVRRQGRTQEERHASLESEVQQLTERAKHYHQQATDVAQLVDQELQRVDRDKMTEFRNAVELHLEVAVEAQKEAIELWETFYARHFATGDRRDAN